MEEILAVTFIFGGGSLFLLSISPVGKAFADRIRFGTQAQPDPQLLEEVEQLRAEVAELHERVDFTERLIASQREADRLPG
jgi:hypothetical protein